jgi:hypothetical protein
MTRRFDTQGVDGAVARLRLAVKSMTAGNCIYGLMRADALAKAGVFRPVLAPDRQVLLQLLMLGHFVHVKEVLWYREVAGMFSYTRQRQMFFPTGAPLHTYLPMNLQHSALMAWDFAVKGRGRPEIGRWQGLRFALAHLWYANRHELLRNDARWRVALNRSPLGRWMKGMTSRGPAPVSG